jgi:hypothetical protein
MYGHEVMMSLQTEQSSSGYTFRVKLLLKVVFLF